MCAWVCGVVGHVRVSVCEYVNVCAYVWRATCRLRCVTGVLCTAAQYCLHLCAACTERLDLWCSALPLREVSDVSETSRQGAR